MIKLFASSFLLTLLTLTSHLSSAQNERHHHIVIKTNSLDANQLSEFHAELQNQWGYKATKACLQEGYVLVEVPVSLGVRLNQAEESTLNLAKSLWGNATLDNDFSVDSINQCAQ